MDDNHKSSECTAEFCVPSTVFHSFYELHYLILTEAIWGGYFYHFHFTVQETKAQRG